MKKINFFLFFILLTADVFGKSRLPHGEGAKMVEDAYSELIEDGWEKMCGWEVYMTVTTRFIAATPSRSGGNKVWIVREVKDNSILRHFYTGEKCIFRKADAIKW